MSEDFLSRWSRRKREVAKAEQGLPEAAQAETHVPEQPPQAGAEALETDKPDEVDLTSLPSLDEITGSTDISGFLRSGVPEELRRSALRKAWTSDPAIRDFVGLAENAWDFNDPAAIPGFGSIDFSPEQVRQMAARLVGDVREVSETIERTAATAMQQDAEPSSPAKPEISNQMEHDTAVTLNAAQSPDAAAQNKIASDAPTERPRRHGSALPR